MPFVDSKITVSVTEDQKVKIKSELGNAITTLHKTENYLMVGIEDNYDLWMAGDKLDKGTYVSVSLFGSASESDYDNMTAKICEIYERELGIPRNAVYVTYHPIAHWDGIVIISDDSKIVTPSQDWNGFYSVPIFFVLQF